MKIDKLEDWRRSHFSTEIGPELDGKEVLVMGWIREIRDLGGIRFIVLQDREGKVQITVSWKEADKEVLKRSSSLHRQDCIGVRGTVRKMDRAPRKAEIIPESIKILGIAKQPPPLDITGRTPTEISVRLNSRILDLCSDRNQAVFKIRGIVVDVMRDFLSKKGFVEVQTPKIITSATEGGAALFPIAYFEREAFLAQSPQLYKEELVIDFEKVFEIGPFYRAEKSNTRLHTTEFTSVDIEEAFVTSKDVMQVAEELVHHLYRVVSNRCRKELAILRHKVVAPRVPFKLFTYDKIIEELQEKGVEIQRGEDLSTAAYRKLGESHPYLYFITDWPTKLKPFYIKPQDDNPELSEAFDLMWSRIEIASGGTRIHDKKVLVKRLKEQGLDKEPFKHHLKAFDFGMPPHAGWAIGLERLIMMLTGIGNIREVILFPRDRFRLTP